jgi:hypothetical protein
MRIYFLCRFCFTPCVANEQGDQVQCPACHRTQPLHLTEAHRKKNTVDRCAVCQQSDLYVRDEPRKLLGVLYLLLGLAGAYFTYGLTLIVGVFGLYWYWWLYPKLTVCYHCYAKYRNSRVNADHREYDLNVVQRFEQAIRNDRTSRDFPS